MDGKCNENDHDVDSEVFLKPLPQGKIYHAFISYRDVDGDSEWVNNLIEKLEKLYQIKCCNHVYDFQPGRKIVENIKDAVLKSVKTLIILSNEYNDSHWCNFEVEYTHQMSMEMREQILIPVLKEDCEIPEHLKPFTYIDARGPIESWLPRLVSAIESPVNCYLESKYSQVDFSTHYRNFDTVHEEKSKNGWFRELPFKSCRYIPDSLNDKAFKLNYFLYRDVLEILSNSTFFKYRQCLFPWIPTLFLGSALLAPGILFLVVTCNQYVFYKNLPSDGNVRDEKRKLMYRGQFAANHILIDHNLLVGFKHYICSATVKVIFIYFNCRPCLDYLEQCFRKSHEDASQCDGEICVHNETTPKSTVNDLDDEAIISLLENEEITNIIEESDRVSVVDIELM